MQLISLQGVIKLAPLLGRFSNFSVLEQNETEILVELDTIITPELKLEGIARNLIRHLNNFRKQLNLTTKKRINLYIKTNDKEILEAIETHEEKIKNMIQADTIIHNLEGKQNIKKFSIESKVVETFIEIKN